jgi:hypothetical protein
MPRVQAMGFAAIMFCGVGAAAVAGGPSVESAEGPVIVPLCTSVPNGSFEAGFDGWTIEKCPGGFGTHFEYQSADIMDLTSNGCDDEAACLTISAYAEWGPDKPSGSAAQAQVTLSRKATVTHRYLTYNVVAAFEALLFNDGESRYVAQVEVTDEQNNRVVCEIFNYKLGDSDFGCGAGVSVLGGIFECQKNCCDVTGPAGSPTGITLGETVLIEVTWSAVSDALFECDIADFGGTLCVDDFRFCSACLQIAPGADALQTTPIDANFKPTS